MDGRTGACMRWQWLIEPSAGWAKNKISDLWNGHHFPRSIIFEVKLPDKVPLTPSNVPTKFNWNIQNRFEKVQKCDFQFKMAAISQNLEQSGRNFALLFGTTQDICLQNITGISVKMRAQGPGQRFKNTFWIISLQHCGRSSSFKLLNTNRSHTSCGT